MTATEPVIECEPETIHAARAVIHPPMTPDQKTAPAGWAIALLPKWLRASTYMGLSEGVFDTSRANPKAPTTLARRTTAQRRRVFHSSFFSASTNATGYSVFSVKSCERPKITTM